MKRLQSVQHEQQLDLGYCLPTCAHMILKSHGVRSSQQQVAKLFATEAGVGTPFTHIERLQRWNFQIQIVRWQGIEAVTDALTQGQDIITAILTTPQLPGWQELVTQHVVLITGIENDLISYHDPALPDGPTHASLNEFWLAWAEMDELAAFIRRK